MTKTKRRPAKRPSGKGRPTGRAPAVVVPAPAQSHEPITIVGVGASAGGLEAFTELLESLPAAPDMAIAKDAAGRWPRPLRVAGCLVPSPEFESSMVLVSVTEEPAPSRDARS